MTNLLTVLLATALSTNPPAAMSNLVRQATGAQVAMPDPDDPVDREYRRLLKLDDQAQERIDGLIQEEGKFAAAADGAQTPTLQPRIERELDAVRKEYERFIGRHPGHVAARTAYGSFLNDLGMEHEAAGVWEQALRMETNNAALYNNLAGIYSHRGPIEKAFEYFERALELDPREPVYLQNFATLTYLFRKDAMERWSITEQQVFDRALALYERALRLDPDNFLLATELAQSYYGIKPLRAEPALRAWRRALELARDDLERQGVLLHLARTHMMAGELEAAEADLKQVTDPVHDFVKQRLQKRLEKLRRGETTPDKDA
ncbi:MAG: tetratricopeptide repeat protein [Limisphaerales bacterium]